MMWCGNDSPELLCRHVSTKSHSFRRVLSVHSMMSVKISCILWTRWCSSDAVYVVYQHRLNVDVSVEISDLPTFCFCPQWIKRLESWPRLNVYDCSLILLFLTVAFLLVSSFFLVLFRRFTFQFVSWRLHNGWTTNKAVLCTLVPCSPSCFSFLCTGHVLQ